MALNAQQSATIASATLNMRKDILTFVLSRKKLKSVKWIKSYFILKIKINREKIRYILQYHYDKGKNAQVCEKICAIYGEDILSKSAARKWFARFRAGNFDVKDGPRSSRPITEKSGEIMVKVERDKHMSTVEIARELGIDHKTVLNHLHREGGLDTKRSSMFFLMS